MSGIYRRAIVCVVAALGACLPARAARAGEHYALLVGVRQYIKSELTPLKFTENDIAGLDEVLRKAGYAPENLVIMTQTAATEDARFLPTAENIRRELKLLLEEPTADDTIVVALSGHDVQFQGEKDVFFCPADARLKDRQTLVSLGSVYEALDACQAASKVLLVDACRNDPQSDLGKAADEVRLEPVGRRAQAAPPPGGIAAFFSCAAGQKSFEIPELRHGVFFHFVIEGLGGRADTDGDKEVTLPELEQYAGKKAKSYVRNQLSESQTPERRGESRGLVALARLTAASNAPPTTPAPSSPSVSGGFAGTRAGHQRDDNALKMKFCWCPPGKFLMGSPPSEPNRKDNEDQVQVTLSRGFWLGKFKVTQAQWESVMRTTLNEQRAKANNSDLFGAGPDHPMYFVNHAEATAFCEELTARERMAGRLDAGSEYRLPTEAQWEYACRAGTMKATAFGDSLSSTKANFVGRAPYNGGAKGPDLGLTAEVGRYSANPWGLCDMHGNVWEWCRDVYQERLPGGDDPEVTEPASGRVQRGGGWCFGGERCSSALRVGNSPDLRNRNLGFRVALVQSRR